MIVFTEDSFDKEYSLEARSYEIFSDDDYFDPSKISTSLSGSSLDGNDDRILRLDIYMKEGWKIDYCYIVE